MRRKNKLVFKDPVTQRHFIRDGYVIIPFLDRNKVDNLQTLYSDWIDSVPGELYASHNTRSFEENSKIDTAIRAEVDEALEEHFCGVRYLLGHFMVKSKENDYDMPLHQDWSITFEETYFAANIWMPLQDVSPNNGGLYVMPGSHLYFGNFRSGSLDLPRIPRDEILDKLVVPVELKAGEAMVYSQALFHGSFSNNSPENRVAVLVSVLENAAPLCYFHVEEESEMQRIKVFSITSDTILRELKYLEKGMPPPGIDPVKVIEHKQRGAQTIDSGTLRRKSGLVSRLANPRYWKARLNSRKLTNLSYEI